MSPDKITNSARLLLATMAGRLPQRRVPPGAITIALACVIGVLGGYGAVLFTFLIDLVTGNTVGPVLRLAAGNPLFIVGLWFVPALGLLGVSWFTRRFAPEAQGHGVPEVILAVARHDGVIRPRVSLVKILASGVCIGTGGSVGREGPIVQIGSSLGSMAGQWFGLGPKDIKVLVAAGAAAGISATFNAPLAGVVFASEIILGNFAVESLTPIVVASVLANVVQLHAGEHGLKPAFPELFHSFHGAWEQLPAYFILGLLCGLAAVGFTKLLYAVEDLSERRLPKWWMRALVLGMIVGIVGAASWILKPASKSTAAEVEANAWTEESSEASSPEADELALPPLFGVGYEVVAHALHLESAERPSSEADHAVDERSDRIVRLDRDQMWVQLRWLLLLALAKPIVTTLTLAGGGSGGIFAPSLFLGATLGGAFGLALNLMLPGFLSAHPGVYAIVGMGAVVAGTTHGTLSAILIVYEMTGDYRIILPIMIAAGLAGVVARFIDHDSIYTKKLTRREMSVARGHEMHRLEHIMVRDVMVRDFPTLRPTDDLLEIVRVARANSHVESLPVMTEEGQLVGIIRPGDLQRAIDTDVAPHLINAEDIASTSPLALPTNANLLEALREFGACDIESLPVEAGRDASRRVVGLLLRSDTMRRYREEMLRRR